MKRLGVLFCVSSLALAADFITGQGARLVIGQRTFTTQSPEFSDTILGGVSGLAYANDTLVVADSNRVGASGDNNRLLIFRSLSRKLPAPTDELPPGERCPVCTGMADVVVGQTEFKKNEWDLGQSGLRQPTAVATDGQMLAVADTDNNRVLIWKAIPATHGAPADLVLGQADFKNGTVNAGTGDPRVPSAKTLRGPQGVWFQNGKLFVADTQNHRVLIWNSIPTSNSQAADIVLGQPNFWSAIEPDLTKATIDAKANTLLNPVSVTSDGRRLYVSDLGHNRVLIWNQIPTQSQQAADVVIGQPDLTTAVANYSSKLCESVGEDEEGNSLYPVRCAATLDFPRYALSDGERLFIADGGNDRVLIFNQIPTSNGAAADIILGQVSGEANNTTESANPLGVGSADSVRTPMSLAWDGTNLYVSDPFNRRILVFTMGSPVLVYTAVRNAASFDVYAIGSITFSGTVKEGDEITITIQEEREYKYKIAKDDTIAEVINGLVEEINAGAGDPSVLALPHVAFWTIMLTARLSGEAGNEISYAVETSTDAQIVPTAAGPTLDGGRDAAKIAPGTLVSIIGDDLSDSEEAAPEGADPLPTELAGVQVYFDGMRAPLLSVTPTQINAQVPFEVNDTNGINAYVRIKRRDGRISVSTAVGVPIVMSNPGIFALPGTDPRVGVVLHGSSQAAGTISVDGIAQAGDEVTVTIEDRRYTYTVQEGDTLFNIRDALIELINQDPWVYAFPAGQHTRIRLRARIAGPEGNGIPYGSSTPEGAQVIMTAMGSELCCANVAYSPVTEANPAMPGETIIVYATGLGIVKPDDAKFELFTGFRYKGPELNEPEEFVASLAGGKTANVLYSGIKRGEVGIYEVHLELNPDLPTNPFTQVWIAQDIYVSNIVTFPLFNPTPPEAGLADIESLSVAPSTVTGGESVTGTVTLVSAAPAGGALIGLSSNNSAASVPAGITIPAGATTGTFSVTTTTVTTTQSVTLTAASANSLTTTLTVTRPPSQANIERVSVAPSTVTGGQSVTGTVTLVLAAPTEGVLVTLSSNNPAASVPASIIIPAGETTGTFSVTTTVVAATQSVTLTATSANSQSTTLTVTPPPPSQAAIQPGFRVWRPGRHADILPVVSSNPGIFGLPRTDPRAGALPGGSSRASGIIQREEAKFELSLSNVVTSPVFNLKPSEAL